jgi:hypothetical protein
MRAPYFLPRHFLNPSISEIGHERARGYSFELPLSSFASTAVECSNQRAIRTLGSTFASNEGVQIVGAEFFRGFA